MQSLTVGRSLNYTIIISPVKIEPRLSKTLATATNCSNRKHCTCFKEYSSILMVVKFHVDSLVRSAKSLVPRLRSARTTYWSTRTISRSRAGTIYCKGSLGTRPNKDSGMEWARMALRMTCGSSYGLI